MKTVKMIMVWLCTGLTALALFSGCSGEAKRIDAQILEEIAESGYFMLASRNETGRYGPVVILPERHDSRLIQAEDAYLMDLLAENSGLARIALEGMFQGETFDGITLPDAGEPERTQTLLWLLENGEFTAPEFMYLVKNFHVFGIEKPEEYEVDTSDKMDYAIFTYLLGSVIINKKQEIPSLLTLASARLETAGDAESYQRYFDEFLALDPWTKETNEIITHGKSLREASKRLRELLNKVESYRKQFEISGEMREDLLEYIKFIDTAIQRSTTMSRAVEMELRKNNGIMAMVIGANHTEDAENYFTSAKINYYVFEPDGLETVAYASNLTNQEYSRKLEQRSVLIDGEIFRILEQERKPQPVLSKIWVKKVFSLAALMKTVARASETSGLPPPYGLNSETLRVGNFYVLSESVTKLDEDTVMFQVTNGREDLYIKMTKNTGAEARSLNVRTALKQIIESLRQQEYRGISEDVVRVLKLGDYTAVMGTSYEAVYAMTIAS
jgi:hypothetical protein